MQKLGAAPSNKRHAVRQPGHDRQATRMNYCCKLALNSQSPETRDVITTRCRRVKVTKLDTINKRRWVWTRDLYCRDNQP